MGGKVVIFSAPSGAGKTTIVKEMLKQEFDLEFSISACSREAARCASHRMSSFPNLTAAREAE